MECRNCFYSPSFICHCSNVYLCDEHLGSHLIKTGNHKYQRLSEEINFLEKSMLDKKLQRWIKSLKKLKLQIIRETTESIKLLKLCSSSILEKINSLYKDYLNLIKTTFLKSEEEKIRFILDSEMTIKDSPLKNLHREIKDAYSKKPYSFTPDLIKIKQVKKNEFLKTHNGGFQCLAISNDGKMLVSGSQDTSVRVWDLLRKSQVACFTLHKSLVFCIALSSDNSFAVSGSFDKTLILWDMRNKSFKNIYTGHLSGIYTVVISQDCSRIVSGSRGNEIMIWRTDSNQCLMKIIASDKVCCGLITLQNIYYSGIGNHLEIWDLNTFTSNLSMKAHNNHISSLALTKNNKFIITGSDDTSVKIWESNLMNLYATLSGHVQEVLSISITEDDKLIVSGSCDQTIILWNIEFKAKIYQYSFHKHTIYSVIVFNDFIYSASEDSRIGVAKISSKSFQEFLNLKPFRVGSEMMNKNLVAFGSVNDVIIFDLNQNNETVLHGHRGMVQAVVISSGMNLLVSSSHGQRNNLILWDLKRKTILSELNGHQNSVFCVDISNDEQMIISGDVLATVRLWDLPGRSEFRFIGHTGQVLSVKFTKNRKFASSGGADAKVIIWDIQNKSLHACLSEYQCTVWRVFVTDDDKYFVSGDLWNGIIVWNIGEKRKEHAFKNLYEASEWLERNRDLEFDLTKYLS